MATKVSTAGQAASGSPGNAFARAWPGLFAFLLLAALLVQGTLVQSHLHFAAPANLRAVAGAASAQLSSPGKDTAADCPLCHEAAMAGAYLLPQAAALPSPPPAVSWLFVAPMAAFGLPAPALGWLSRAPPQ